MADVLMAEPSSSTHPAQTRREHLLQTFEAYRAELDADVSTTPSGGGCALIAIPAVLRDVEVLILERATRTPDHHLPNHHPALEEANLSSAPRRQPPQRRTARQEPQGCKGQGAGDIWPFRQCQERAACGTRRELLEVGAECVSWARRRIDKPAAGSGQRIWTLAG